jgi:hypothetical protein
MNTRKKYNTVKTASQERYAHNSKKRLIKNIEKKFKTTMIGALSYIEEELGHLWGFESDSPLTASQRQYMEVWQELRSAILNNGNNQLRACLDEIAQYTMTWDRYQTQFLIKKDSLGENNNE